MMADPYLITCDVTIATRNNFPVSDNQSELVLKPLSLPLKFKFGFD